ncbi:MAG: hypothetical protein ACRD4H_07655, partial [Candidatus Acidiferrales bacterium]
SGQSAQESRTVFVRTLSIENLCSCMLDLGEKHVVRVRLGGHPILYCPSALKLSIHAASEESVRFGLDDWLEQVRTIQTLFEISIQAPRE